MKKIVLALLLSIAVVVPTSLVTGCGTQSAVTTEYRTLGSVVQARDLAMKSFAAYYVSKKPPGSVVNPDLEAKSAQVGKADEQFRNAMIAFRGVVTVAYSDKTQAPLDVAAAADSLIRLINSFTGGVK